MICLQEKNKIVKVNFWCWIRRLSFVGLLQGGLWSIHHLSLFYCMTVVAFTTSLLTGVIGGIAVICGGHANKF